MRDKGFSPLRGRSCQPLALRNQWLTDVGGRRRRQEVFRHAEKGLLQNATAQRIEKSEE